MARATINNGMRRAARPAAPFANERARVHTGGS
jgi:hypothetical protein